MVLIKVTLQRQTNQNAVSNGKKHMTQDEHRTRNITFLRATLMTRCGGNSWILSQKDVKVLNAFTGIDHYNILT